MASWSEEKIDNVSPPTEDMLEDEANDFLDGAMPFDGPYAPTDPKSSGFHRLMSDIWDMREKG